MHWNFENKEGIKYSFKKIKEQRQRKYVLTDHSIEGPLKFNGQKPKVIPESTVVYFSPHTSGCLGAAEEHEG